MLKRISEQELLRKPLTEEQRREILHLIEMGDEGIDLSDIPEIDLSKVVRAEPPGFVRKHPIYLASGLQKRLSEIAARRGVVLDDLVNEVLERELAIAESLR